MNQKSEKKRRLGLQAKLLLIIFPIFISTLLISDILSRKFFYDSMTGSGQKFSSYKADQLEKYSFGQWQLLIQNDLIDKQVYIDAAFDTVSSYLRDLTSSESEIFFALDGKGDIPVSSGDLDMAPGDKKDLLIHYDKRSNGWIEIEFSGRTWVGHTFYFSHFDWQYFLVEDKKIFYSEIDRIAFIENFIILLLSAITIFLVLFFVNYMFRPLKRVTTGIRYITDSRRFDKKVEVEFPDEIGDLAHEFNVMTSTLGQVYERLKNVALSEAIARKEVIRREMETLGTLSSAAEYKDPETGAHTQRVGEYARMLVRVMGHDEEKQNLIRYAAPLHDIGKIGISDNILLKPGRLDDGEFLTMKTHAEIGHNILKNSGSKYLLEGAEIAFTHHERFDGGGYPRGLAGEEIPLSGRIVCVVDVFDALVSLRPYKKPWSFEKAAELLRSEKGRQFDPQIVDLFLDNYEEVQSIFHTIQDD